MPVRLAMTTEPWASHRLARSNPEMNLEAVVTVALRTRSSAALDALALSCTHGALGERGLQEAVLAEGGRPTARTLNTAPGPLAATAIGWAGLRRTPADLEAAGAVFESLWATADLPTLSPSQQLVVAQVWFATHRFDVLAVALPLLVKITPIARHYLATDVANPFFARPGSVAQPELSPWLAMLSQAFTTSGLSGLTLEPTTSGDGTLFDRLGSTTTQAAATGGELVTVVMPCYKPDYHALITAVTSITTQTWQDLEIVIVDDHSGAAYDEVFDHAVGLDPRTRLIRLDRNSGTYLAREAAVAASSGSLVTFQDADDWSHPSRIEHQIHTLTEHGTPMSRSLAVRAKDDLTHQWVGAEPVRVNASSLLIRREVLHRCGGFLPVRKGADAELAERITTLIGPIPDTATPLAITRLRHNSLSRNDFAYHWSSPDRQTFRSAYQAWHRSLQATISHDHTPAKIDTAQVQALPFPVPLNWVYGLDAAELTPNHLDVAYVGNLSIIQPSEQMKKLRRRLTLDGPPAAAVGLWHLEAPWTATVRRPCLSKAWMDLVHEHPGLRPLCRLEPMHVDKVVVIDPEVLTLIGDVSCHVRADRVEIRLSLDSLAPTSSGRPLDVHGIADAAHRWWGIPPVWTFAPELDSTARQTMSAALPGLVLERVARP